MPLPVPVAPAVTVIHASLLVAVQPHPVDALTVTTLEAPAAATVDDIGDSAETHGTPACVTVKVWPPTVTVPVRDALPALAATL